MTCPRCREPMKFVDYRRITWTTLMGGVVCERPYYHGCDCKSGWFPTDEELGVEDRHTPAVAEVVSQQATLEPFDDAARKSLPRLSGLNLSASTVRRIAERVGRDLAERRERGETFGDERDWDWNEDAHGRRCAYASVDATGVPQQAEDASAADGRMALVGEIFNPVAAGDRGSRNDVRDKRYLAGLMSQPELARQLRREAQAVGLDRADVLIGLTDGGAGLQRLLETVLAGLGTPFEFVLDFYHATRHLRGFAEVLHAGDEAAAKERADAWCHALKHEGGESLLADLERLELPGDTEVRESHRRLCNYLRNNLHRTDYPRYVANGWQIGSGSIESACKNVVNGRLNGPGMRWSEHGTHELAHLRALHKSEPSAWRSYWTRGPTATAA